MKRASLSIGLVQMRMSSAMRHNETHAAKLVATAATRGAKIICLPELYRSRYFPQKKRGERERYAETIPGPSTRLFSRLAEKYRVVIIVPVYEMERGRFYNSAVVIDERGRLLPTYRKIHIPHDPQFWEKSFFENGTTYRIYKTTFATFAVLICYDQWFPEAARAVALRGADIIFYPTAIARRIGHREKEGDWGEGWQTVMRGHAIANAVHVAAVNRIGREDRLTFFGGSFVADSFGKIVKHASRRREEIVIAKLDLGLNSRVRKSWMFFQNRRPDTYSVLTKKVKRP